MRPRTSLPDGILRRITLRPEASTKPAPPSDGAVRATRSACPRISRTSAAVRNLAEVANGPGLPTVSLRVSHGIGK